MIGIFFWFSLCCHVQSKSTVAEPPLFMAEFKQNKLFPELCVSCLRDLRHLPR